MCKLLVASFLLAGCASMLPTRTIDGVAVYIRDGATVDAYCRPRVRADNLAPTLYGCYIKAANTIMVRGEDEDTEARLAHELRHVAGWEHRGPCDSRRYYPDGITTGGHACDWYRP